MGELYFKAELLDDVVLSQRTATVGDHKSLDYIPGSAFLGIAASWFYSKMNKEDSWKVFHSSNVRFYNAYPMINEKRSMPIPLSLHSQQVPEIGKENDIYNFVYSDIKEDSVQYRQNRRGYVNICDDGKIQIAQPSKTSRMRTAIDAKTGTAAKSQLYGYESLDAGQFFIGKIEWDDSLKETITPIVSLFESDEIVHVGRSKTASYGRVKISRMNKSDINNSAQSLDGTSFSILAISDLCLKNPNTGTPELNVLPSFLGLGEDWTLDRQKSFSRPSCVYQYNSHRKEIEMQKTLISKGSVFTFKSEKEITAEEKEKLLSAVKNGIGEARNQGFGEISLFDFGMKFQKEDAQDKADFLSLELKDNEREWLNWLKQEFRTANVEEKVKKAVSEFVRLCKSIKVYQCFDNEKIFWPGNAQWGRVLEAARACTTKEELHAQLFEGENPVIKQRIGEDEDAIERNPDKEWNYEASSKKDDNLRKWLENFINDDKINDREIKIALQELVKKCKDKIADKNWLMAEETAK